MPGSLSGKVAVVTGAAGGIGRASALEFAREGASVVVADVTVEGGEETVRLIGAAGGEALFVRTDVTSAASVEALMTAAVERYGRLDFAHNNAGVEGKGSLPADCPEEEFDRVIAINLKGVFLGMKFEIPNMIAAGGGAIVNTSSIGGIRGLPTLIAYSASKHAVVGMTQSAALAYAKQGIRVNAICPGLIHTAMAERATGGTPQAMAAAAAQHPVGRLGKPEEVGATVVWLCSESAAFITGHALTIDGGRTVSA